jgi:hypothetical protein
MPPRSASALTIVRVAHGQPRPEDAEFRRALERDRTRLGLPSQPYVPDIGVAGPYCISVDGRELDEYVVWER